MWLSPNIVNDLLWDYNMCTNSNMNTVIKEICQKALKAQLSQEDIKVKLEKFICLS